MTLTSRAKSDFYEILRAAFIGRDSASLYETQILSARVPLFGGHPREREREAINKKLNGRARARARDINGA